MRPISIISVRNFFASLKASAQLSLFRPSDPCSSLADLRTASINFSFFPIYVFLRTDARYAQLDISKTTEFKHLTALLSI